METLDFEVRYEADITNQSPGRLVGTLLTYEQRAADRAELFTSGSLHWPENGIIINQQHDRARPIVRAVPFEQDGAVLVDVALPNTTAGRDAATNVREGIFTGLSVEFRSEIEGQRVKHYGRYAGLYSARLAWWIPLLIRAVRLKFGKSHTLTLGASLHGCNSHHR